MEVKLNFTAAEQDQLAQIAQRDGKANAGELLQEAAMRLLDEDARFRAAVLEGKSLRRPGRIHRRRRDGCPV